MNEDERQGLPSASPWRRYELCAASFQLEQEARRLDQLAYQEPSKESARGDRIHAAQADQEVSLDESETVTADLLRERANDQANRVFGGKPVTILKEKRLWLTIGGVRAASGQFDRVVHNDSLAVLQDFKTGWAEPDSAEQNAQLKFLSVVVAMHLPHVTQVIAQIISGPFGVNEVRFGLRELASAYNDVVATLRKLRDPQARPNPGPAQCRFCPALMICPAVKDLIVPITKLSYFSLPAGADAANVLDTCELLERRLTEIRAHYRRIVEANPDAIPGYGLEPGAPRRHVKDWIAARSKLEEFISQEALDKLQTFSIPEVEKLLGAAIGVRGSKLKEQLKFVLGDLLEEKFPQPALKRIKGEAKTVTLG